MPIDFAPGADLARLREVTRDFIDQVVIPAEAELAPGAHGVEPALVARLRDQARAAGVFAPTAPVELGGLGLDHVAQALVLEESGRSLIGPVAMNCAAPDEGNILLLHKVATADQAGRYLGPLARGEVRSCFAMTEPSPGAGSDPSLLATSAVPSGDGWQITGRKWFITGAEGAAFAIVMARTAEGATLFLVDSDNPGLTIVRRIETLDTGFAGGHCELAFDGCQVPGNAVLGGVGEGFRYAQVRLGPARLTHCMRWLGAARRAHEVAVGYAAGRPMFGSTLGELGLAQQLIADNEIDLAAARGLIWQAAWMLDQGQAARQEVSIAKTFAGEAVGRVVDRSLQLCGAFGVSHDGPIARIYAEVRPFRIYDGPSEVHRWSIARRSIRRAQNSQTASQAAVD